MAVTLSVCLSQISLVRWCVMKYILKSLPHTVIYCYKAAHNYWLGYVFVKFSTGFRLLVLCVSLVSTFPQPGGYILRRSGQSGLWALSAGSRHESAQCCKTIGQRAAFACQEDQSEGVWPTDTSFGGRQSKRQGEHIQMCGNTGATKIVDLRHRF